MWKTTESVDTEMFEELQEALYLHAAMVNAHMFLEFKWLPEVERRVEISRQLAKIEDLSKWLSL